MANLKISELTELAATPAANDVLAIVDTDVLTTKKITPANLMGGYQPLDTALTNISGLTYVSPSFIKLTAGDTYAVRTLSETLSDIGAAATDQTMYIGTTGVAINRGTGALTLAGITLTTPDIGTPSDGVLTSCTGLPYSGLANGTDGNLITWDAAGAIALVATGDATQVLTSNGVGTAPTFQAAAGGAVATDAIWDVAGDLAIGTGADTASKLAIGTAAQVLTVNAGATAPEWADAGGGGAVGGLYGINVETLAGNKTLTAGIDQMYQYLDEGGADRIITLDTASASAGDRFVIRHNGVYNDAHYFFVKQAATILDWVYAGGIKEFIFDGTNWISGEAGTGDNDSKRDNTSFGYRAKSYDLGTSFGAAANGSIQGAGSGWNSNGSSYGAALGHSSDGRNSGVAVGFQSDGADYGVALGRKAQTNNKKSAVAIGYYAETERVGEIAHNINGDDTDQENNITIGGWEGATADATPLEIFCGGQANERFLVRASSVLVFTMLITARDNVAEHGAAYKIEGAIKRDAAGNTAMLAAATVTVIHEDDAAWDVAVTADDTNEALIITVTGDDTNITQWAARLDGVETHF